MDAAGEERRVRPCASRGVAGGEGDGRGPAAAGLGVPGPSGTECETRCPRPRHPGCSPGGVYSKSRFGAPGRGGVGPVCETALGTPWLSCQMGG